MTVIEADVTVVGAGPVGLTVANILGQSGVDVAVLERHPRTVTESRAAVLDAEGLRALHLTGLGAELLDGMCVGAGHTSLDRHGRPLVRVAPTSMPIGYPHMAWIHQPDVERTLSGGLRRFPSCRILMAHEATNLRDDGHSVLVSGHSAEGTFSVRSRYVVGADGARSTTRSRLGVNFVGSTYQEPWLVLDLEGDATGLPAGSTFAGDPRRPYITAELPGRRRRWEFMVLPGERDEDLLSDERIHALLSAVVDVARTGRVARRTVYRFHARRASEWKVGSVFLAGDAAHVMPPFAGQGLNSGLRDAANLSWKLTAVLGGAPEQLLDTYEEERRPHLVRMTRTAIAIGRMNNTTSRAVAAVRDGLTRGMLRLPAARRAIQEGRTYPWPRYRRGAFLGDPSRLTGSMLPGLQMLGEHAELVAIDHLLGEGWAIVGCGPSFAWALTEEVRSMCDALSASVLRIDEIRGGAPSVAGETVGLDPTGGLRHWLGERWRDLLLVRPDRFVFGVAPGHELAAMLARAPLAGTRKRLVHA